MHLRSCRIALMLVAAAALAACEGTVGTVEDSGTASTSTTGTASTSGAGGDAVSGTQTAAGTEGSGTITSATAPRHPLDDPATPLGTHTIYFEFDSSDVPTSAQPVIEAHAAYLSEHAGASVTLEGHADERGSREYNIGLGEKRALAVRRLMSLLGATGPQIRTISYGEERPADAGHEESAWQLNRRVEIVYRTRE
ncbi:MAG: peptidoglycan-associated lipoprotein Pal [Chromatiales bacterium]|nr:peptidoglycan-associated lipoprotein Pal [Chromatiales bacterium]